MKKLIILLTCLVHVLSVEAQIEYTTNKSKAIKYYVEGMKQMRLYYFDEAKELFQKAIDKDEAFVEPHLSMAVLYQQRRDYDKALDYFKLTAEKDKEDQFVLVYKSLAQVYLHQGRYTEAKNALNTLINKDGVSRELSPVVKNMMNTASFGEQAMKNPVPFNPINLGGSVNSAEEEYHPSMTVDDGVIVFTRKVPLKTRSGDKIMREDIYYSNKEGEEYGFAYNLGEPINTLGYNEGAQCISADGQYIFYTACEKRGGFGSCDIYYARKSGDGWSSPKNLGPDVNSPAWESQPTLSADGLTLYFVSNRDKGEDIWKTKKQPNGTWSKPVKLPFNTKGRELAPFLHPDGQTMYFASDGYTGMGKSDVFVIRKDANGNWGEPENLGYPINTAREEHGIVVSSDGKTAFFSSDREGGFGTLDIYQFELPESARSTKASYLKGTVVDAKTKRPVSADFELIDLSDGEIAVASSSSAKGKFLVTLPPNRDYALNVSKPGYMFHSETFTLKEAASADPVTKNVPLQPIEVGASVVLKNVFFETASYNLKPTSQAELRKLVEFMKLNKSTHIEIGGHTDNVGSAASNKTLSEQRAKAVYDFLVENGIQAERLQFKGYGAENPIADNETEEGRARNRRTEFKVVG